MQYWPSAVNATWGVFSLGSTPILSPALSSCSPYWCCPERPQWGAGRGNLLREVRSVKEGLHTQCCIKGRSEWSSSTNDCKRRGERKMWICSSGSWRSKRRSELFLCWNGALKSLEGPPPLFFVIPPPPHTSLPRFLPSFLHSQIPSQNLPEQKQQTATTEKLCATLLRAAPFFSSFFFSLETRWF